MAKMSLKELYNKYDREYSKLEAKYGPGGRTGKLNWDEFEYGFKERAKELRKELGRDKTNAQIAKVMAENSYYYYNRKGAEEMSALAKQYLGKDIKYIDLRRDLGGIGSETLKELRKMYEQGLIDGEEHHSSIEWKDWSASYIFGSL